MTSKPTSRHSNHLVNKKRSIPKNNAPTLSALRTRFKQPRHLSALVILLVAILGAVSFAAALTHTVQEGDTLTALANRYGTTVEEIAAANGIENVNLILIGQELVIPTNTASGTTHSGLDDKYEIAPGNSQATGLALKAAIDAQFDIPAMTTTQTVSPEVSADKACMRFNFLRGKDATRGSRGGVFVAFDNTNGALTSWYGAPGATDSGWFNGFNITFEAIHAKVIFYPNSGTMPVVMKIVNPAPGTSYGWLSRGMCHALEIEYP